MINNYSFLFPGQGSQYVGMGKNLIKKYKVAMDYFNIANNILQYDLRELSLNGPDEILNQTKYTQPAIFINSIIKDYILKSKGIIPNAVAGHSLGEFSALVSAEIISLKDAIRIIKVRSEKMNEIGKIKPGKMAAIFGASNREIENICNQQGIVVPANINTPKQIVISGEVDAVNKAIMKAKSLGFNRIIPIKVSGAFHSPLMKSVREPLEEIINSIKFNNAKIPIYQNISSTPTINAKIIKSNLINQLENPVQWAKTIINMNKNKLNNFIEVGPGNILSRINNKILDKSVNNSIKEFIY